MNRIDSQIRPRATRDGAANSKRRLRPASLALAIGSALGLVVVPVDTRAGEDGSSITRDGRTDSKVERVGSANRWKVTTKTIRDARAGQVAFNSFREFGVEAGQTVDLILPNNTDGKQVNNLVNLVWDSKAYINGTLNGFLADEKTVGGRVFFVDPHGVVVGSQGVLNVGSLSIATPTSKVMEDMLTDGAALTGLMTGTLTPDQISRDGVVSIAGTVNASNGVRVQARVVDVTGTILVAQAPATGRDSASSLQRLQPAVNPGATPDGMELVDDGGKIQLRAAAISDTGAGLRNATATVTVGCDGGITCGPSTLRADAIELSALAVADSSYENPDMTPEGIANNVRATLEDASQITGLLNAAAELGLEQGLSGQVAFLHVDTTARVEVKGNSQLQAYAGDVALHAATRQVIDTSAAGKAYEKGEVPELDEDGNQVVDKDGKPVTRPKKHTLSLGAAYAQVDATTEAIIRSGAQVDAGAGALTVKADADTKVDVAAESFATNNTALGFTAAISNVNVNTNALVEASSQAVVAGAVNVSAVNSAELSTSATARSDQNGKVGLAGAVSLQDIQANAVLDRGVVGSSGMSTGDVTVQAASIARSNSTTSLVDAPKKGEKDPDEVEDSGASGGGLMDLVQGLAGKGIGKASSKLSGSGSGSGSGGNGGGTDDAPSPFRLGGAISFVHGNHGANARIGNNVKISSVGDIVVDSQVIDAQIANHALSNIQGKGKGQDGTEFSLSGAVSIALLDHEAETTIGEDAELGAARIGLNSNVTLPRDFSKLHAAKPNFSSFDAFKDSISAAKSLISDPSDLFTTYGSAKGSADKLAIGGVVSYFKARNSARTDVASGASLSTSNNSGGAWSANLDGADQGGNDRVRQFAAATAIQASTDITALHAAGDLGLTLKRVSVADGGAAVGGSVGYLDYQNSATAIVNDGVSIDTNGGDLAIDAHNKEFIVSLALQSGQGGSIGVNGTASALDLDSRTVAGLSNRARVDSGSVDLSAEEDLFVWSVAGAVTMTDSISVGASVAYQQMDSDTAAFIGDIPQDLRTGSAGGTVGHVNTSELNVHATTGGLSGAVAAAGAMVRSKSASEQQQQDQLTEKQNAENPSFHAGLLKRAQDNSKHLDQMGAAASEGGSSSLGGYFDKAKGLLGAGGGQGGSGKELPQPAVSIGVAGSATVNRVRQNTRASIAGATIGALSGAPAAVDVAAINKALLISISGAISIVNAQSDNSQASAAIAAGLAYGDVRNDTVAEVQDSTISDTAGVDITARNENEQVNVGLGVGVNKSKETSVSAAVAASVTLGMSRNRTEARLQDSTITGKGGTDADLSLHAVNRSRIANGGGALYFGGKQGVGAAVTYADIRDTANASILGGSISDVNDVTVSAADASRIVAAAASGGYSGQTGSIGLAGSVVVNQVANDTVARIADGAQVSFSGNLEAFAGTATIRQVPGTAGDCDSQAHVDYCGSGIGAVAIDANIEAKPEADGKANRENEVQALERNHAKSSIIAVAGMLQAADSNAGIAFGYNTIDNTHVVEVNGATLTATSTDGGQGQVNLVANDRSDILAFSAGIGVATGNFAGVGSASYNAIRNNTAVLVGTSLPDASGAVQQAPTSIDARSLALDASDDAYIGSLSGAVTVGQSTAVGAALTINEIGNDTQAVADDAELTVAEGDVKLHAANRARILSGAVAAGMAGNVAVQGSVAWSRIGNNAEAILRGGSVDAGDLMVEADNTSRIQTLTGGVAVGQSAVGAAVNIATIGDKTVAGIDDAQVHASGSVDVAATADSVIKTLAIAGTHAGNAAITVSNSTNLLNTTTEARIAGLRMLGKGATGDVRVRAENTGKTYSLAGSLAASGSAGVGAASSVNCIGTQSCLDDRNDNPFNTGDKTRAVVVDSQLDNVSSLAISAASSSLIRSAAIGGASGGSIGGAASVTTNLINSDTLAELVDTSITRSTDSDDNVLTEADVSVQARDKRHIDSLAGGAAGGGTAGLGAAVAYNDIAGHTTARVAGGSKKRALDVRHLLVSADAAGTDGGNRIRTAATGIGLGGQVGGAASVAVNRMQGQVKATIADGADVVAQGNIGVLAAQQQHVQVLAGSIGGGFAAGVGAGTVVNLIEGSTEASITGADTRVTALALEPVSLNIDSGKRLHANALSTRDSAEDLAFDSADLKTGLHQVQGLAVNASTKQQVDTLGFSAAVSASPIFSGSLSVMAAVNRVAGSTKALIQDAQINQSGLYLDNQGVSHNRASLFQSVDVRASQHVASNSYVFGVAGAPGVFSGAGAVSTNLFDGNTQARVENATIDAADAVHINAAASHNALAIVVGASAALGVGFAGTGVVNQFDSNTEASLLGGKLRANSLDVIASSDNAGAMVAGTGAAGGLVGIGGAALVNVSRSRTQARIGRDDDASRGTNVSVHGALQVDAGSASRFQGTVISGAGAGAVGLAGMAQVHVVENDTRALLTNSVARSGSLAVNAHDVLRLNAYSGALGVGVSAGIGIGAGASVALLGSTVRADIVDSNTRSTGTTRVSANSDRAVDMVTMTAGAGGSTGIGGAAGLLLAGLDKANDDENNENSQKELGRTFGKLNEIGNSEKIDAATLGGTLDADAIAALNGRGKVDPGQLEGRGDLVKASVSGGALHANALEIASSSLMSSRNIVGGSGAGGIVGIGGSFGMSALYGSTLAELNSDVPVVADRVEVSAQAGNGSAGDALDVDAYAGALGTVGVGAAVAVARQQQDVKAKVRADVAGVAHREGLRISALDGSNIGARANGMAAGAAAVGVVVADARRASAVAARLDDDADVTGLSGIVIKAQSLGGTRADAVGAAGGVLAGASAAIATADDASTVDAEIGDKAKVTLAVDGIQVLAEAQPNVDASATGASVSKGVAVGAAVANATASTKVNAKIGDKANFNNVGEITISADVHGGDVLAKAISGSGGLFLSGAGAFATAQGNNVVAAGIGAESKIVSPLRLQLDADEGSLLSSRKTGVTINARNDSSQRAQASGVSLGGVLAVGLMKSHAQSDAKTNLNVGNKANWNTGTVVLSASGADANHADAIAGSGGAVAGNATIASTHAGNKTKLDIGSGGVFKVGKLLASARHDTGYGSRANSSSAGVLNASGALAENAANSNVDLKLGAGTRISADGDVWLVTDNAFNSLLVDELAASAAGGGVATGNASSVVTTLKGHSKIDLANDANINTGLAPDHGNSGLLNILASTHAKTDDRAGLSTGGGLSVAKVHASTTTAFENAVGIGEKATLESTYMLNVGTLADLNIQANALVNTWGVLAAAGEADAKVDIGLEQNVTLKKDATLESLDNMFVLAGEDGRRGQSSRVTGNAIALGYIKGTIAIPKATAESNINSNAKTSLDSDSKLLGARFVWLGAQAGHLQRNATGTATGYEVGLIPVTRNDSKGISKGAGHVHLDGTVLAGRYNKLDITIDAAGRMTSSGNGSDTIEFDSRRWETGTLLAALHAQGNYEFDAAAAKTHSGDTWQFGTLYASGGDVTLNADTFSGSGSITARGKPQITVTNHSNDHVLFGDMLIPDYSGGRILFTGGTTDVGDIALHEASNEDGGKITIDNLGGMGSSIATGGTISNPDGAVRIHNAQGSIYGWGDTSGETVSISAPNGEVGYKVRGNWWGNSPATLWARYSLASDIRNANDAAAYIASWLYINSGEYVETTDKTDVDPNKPSLTNWLLYQNSDSSNNNGTGSIFVYGGCFYRVDENNCNLSDLQHLYYDNGVQSKYAHKSENWWPIVYERTIRRSLTYQPGDVTRNSAGSNPGTGPGIEAGSGIKITAGGFLDVNVPLRAGKGVDWSVRLLSESRSGNLRTLEEQVDIWNAQGSGLYTVSDEYLEVISGGATARKIVLQYNAATGQFETPDKIDANGGGAIYLDGKIVSTTTSGSLNVISGRGSVKIDTSAINGKSLVLHDITVGNAAPGVIEITDRLQNTRTKYVSNAITGKVTGTRWVLTDNGDAVNPVDLGRNTATYNPEKDWRATWTQTARIRRADANQNWYWADANGNQLGDGQQWTTSQVRYEEGASAQFESEITSAEFSFFRSTSPGYRCEGTHKQSQTCAKFRFGFPANGVFWDGSANASRTVWQYSTPLRGTLIVTNTVKADNAIAINFQSNNLGVLEVTSDGDLLLNGALRNRAGTTNLTSRSGDILASSKNAKIITNSLNLDAAGKIGELAGAGQGEALRPLDVQLVSYTGSNNALVLPGTLIATSGRVRAGDIALNVETTDNAPLQVRLSAGSRGNVWLKSKYDITGIAGDAVSIDGRDLTLYSESGAIGSLSKPLVVAGREAPRSDGVLEGGLVHARAAFDVALTDTAGDLWVQRVKSEHGDVRLEARDGAIFSAAQRGATSSLSEEQLQSLRQNLKLQGGGAEQSIRSYENRVNSAYAEYFQLLEMGTVVDGVYQPDGDAITLFRATAEAAGGEPLDDAGVAAWLAGRYQQLTGEVFTEAFGENWANEAVFAAAFNPTYRYQLRDTSGDSAALAARKTELVGSMSDDAVWTDAQLRYVLNANALEPSSGVSIDIDPVISGRNVTLVAKGDLGRLDKTFDLSLADLLAGNVDPETALAMLLATTPGDVELLDAAGKPLSREQIENGAVVVSLRINSTSPVVVEALGKLNGDIGGDTYLHGTTGLEIDVFRGTGNARIGSDADITGRSSGTPAISVGGDLSISAGGNISGYDNRPLLVQINRTLLLANAGQNLALSQASGDLRVGIASGNEEVTLKVGSGSLLSYLDEVVAVTGRNLRLDVRDDIRSEDGGRLALRILDNGQLDAEAGRDIRISSDGDLPVDKLAAGRDLDVLVANGSLSGDTLQAGGDVKVLAREGITVQRVLAGGKADLNAPMGDIAIEALLDAANVNLVAGANLSLGNAKVDDHLNLFAVDAIKLRDDAVVDVGNSVSARGASLAMGNRSQLLAGHDIAVNVDDDIELGNLTITGNAVDARITLDAGGGIHGNGDDTIHINGGSNVQASLQAGTGIGSAAQPLQVDVGKLTLARTTQGDLFLHLPNGGEADDIDAQDGDVTLSSDALLVFDRVNATGHVRIEADSLQGNTATAGDSLHATTNGAMTLGTISSGGDALLSSGATLSLTQGAIGGNATLDSRDAMTVDTLAVTGDAGLNSGSTLDLTQGTVGGNATLDSRDAMTVDTLVVTGDAGLNSGSTLDLTQGTVGGNATLDSRDAMTVGTLAVTGDAKLDAGTRLTADTLTIDGQLVMDSGAAMVVTTAEVGGDATLTSLGTLDLTQGTIGGNATLDSRDAMTVDTLVVTGDAGLNSGSTLDLTQGTVGGNATLDSRDAMTVGTLAVTGDAGLNSGSTLDLTQGTVGGNATLDASDAMTVGTLAVTGDAKLDSGTRLAAETLTIDGQLVMDSGAAMAVTTAKVRADATLTSLGTLDLTQGTIGGNATLDSRDAMSVGTLAVTGDAGLNSGSTLDLTQGTVGGNATLDSRDAMTVGTLAVTGDAGLNSGSTLDLTQGTVGGNATLDASDAMTVGTLAVTGDAKLDAGTRLAAETLTIDGQLEMDSGAAMAVTTAKVGADATLTSLGTLDLTQGTVGGNATLDSRDAMTVGTLAVTGDAGLNSGSTLDLTQGTVGGNATLDASGDMGIGTLQVTRNAKLDSAGALTAGSVSTGEQLDADAVVAITADDLRSGTDMTLHSNGDVSVKVLDAGTLAIIDSGRDITLGQATSGTDMRLTAAQAIRVEQADIGVDGDWVAGTDLEAETVSAGCNFKGDAGGRIRIGDLQAGCGIRLASGDTLSFRALVAGGDIVLISRRKDVLGGSADAGASITVDAARNIAIEQADAGHDLRGDSGGSQSWGRYQVGADAELLAGGDVDIGSGITGGAQSIISGGSIRFDRVQAGSTATMDAQGGSLSGTAFKAVSGDLAARDHLQLGSGEVDTRLTLAADTVQAHVTQSEQGDGPLTMELTGYQDGIARRVVVEVDPRDAWLLERLKAVEAELVSSVGKVDVVEGHIGETMTLNTPQMRVLMDNTSPLLKPVDVQLTQLDKDFRLSINGVYMDTDAYVVRFADGFRVTSPNYNRDHADSALDYLGESAVRYTGRMLQTEPDEREEKRKLLKEKDIEVITSKPGAVNTGANN
ncbi:leukotoxin LktA family filamentous adhesin [Luteimonas sp. e5]